MKITKEYIDKNNGNVISKNDYEYYVNEDIYFYDSTYNRYDICNDTKGEYK